MTLRCPERSESFPNAAESEPIGNRYVLFMFSGHISQFLDSFAGVFNKRLITLVSSVRSNPNSAVTRRRVPVDASPTGESLQPEAIGAGMEETKCLKPSDSGSRIGNCASAGRNASAVPAARS